MNYFKLYWKAYLHLVEFFACLYFVIRLLTNDPLAYYFVWTCMFVALGVPLFEAMAYKSKK